LRDYGIEPTIWDGEEGCEHEWGNKTITLKHKSGETNPGKESWFKDSGASDDKGNCFCTKCGAWRGSLGLEPTFELYIKHLCDIFDEVKRVLRKDGTCWVNLGDSYNSHTFGNSTLGGGLQKKLVQKEEAFPRWRKAPKNLGDKSLCLIPQRFAIEMVNRGWILRNTIIWHKPNCMPSSAKDRFTVDFEYVYFFVKSKKYWFEQVFEELNYDSFRETKRGKNQPKAKLGDLMSASVNARKSLDGWKINPNGRNKRAVWTIPTKPFPEAHFAVYPEALIEPMIQAGCPKYVCKKCGKAREKIYKETREYQSKNVGGKSQLNGNIEVGKRFKDRYNVIHKELGYTDCGCNAGFEGGIVLDPFSGAGTTAVVAKKQGKRYLGIELKKEYIDMANKKIRAIPELLPF